MKILEFKQDTDFEIQNSATWYEFSFGAHSISDAVTSFWAALSFLLLFAYPTPELPTPSFEYHTAFNGVAFGIVSNLHPFKIN